MTPDNTLSATALRVVRGRLAPSPTGFLHLGNAWAFLLGWLAVRAESGQLLLRMEDIDPDRSRPEYREGILRDLEWLGLDWDEGPDRGGPYAPYSQGERLERYDEALRLLHGLGHVYPCYCSRKELKSMASAPHAEDIGPVYPGTCLRLGTAERVAREALGRRPTLRFHGEGDVTFVDLVQGAVGFGWDECGGDFPLRRSDGVISYQLAVSVDDFDQGVTVVVRGRDILPSTPRQIVLIRLLGGTPPCYAHVPLLIDHQGARLAKRHNALELRALREAGVSPRAVVGWLACRAGLVPSAVPLRPQELLGRFAWRLLPRARVCVDANIVEQLQNIE